MITVLVGVVSVFAIFYAPIVALQVQEKNEVSKERNKRKMDVFRSLMNTRAQGESISLELSSEHIQAINMILLDFYDNQAVIDAWKIYFDHLIHPPTRPPEANNNEGWLIWNEKRKELFIELLYIMSHAVGYDFDKVNLKSTIYYPQGLGDFQQQNILIRNGLLDIISGKRAIKIEVQEQNKIKP